MNTIEKLDRAMVKNDSLVCVGLDPDWSKMPDEYTQDTSHEGREGKIYNFLTTVVDITGNEVCSYKVQKAFFDLYPEGHSLLRNIIQYIHHRYSEVPVFVDCKIGDIDNTMEAYGSLIFDDLNADGVVLNPYMGEDVFSIVKDRPEKAGIVLVKTSNESSVQDLKAFDGRRMWEHVLDATMNEWNTSNNLIPVLSSLAEYSANPRTNIPNDVPILLAGYGAQGGDASNIADFLNNQKRGVFINSSRKILYPYNTEDMNWRDNVALEVKRMKAEINKHRDE